MKSESGVIRKNWQGRKRVCLVYPNYYSIGMSNLGFQTVYEVLNQIDDVVCERAFLPQQTSKKVARMVSIESNRPLSDFDIIAFSMSFENDYPNLLTILDKTGIPLRSEQRSLPHPLIIAGGVTCFLNPEPIAPFIDCFIVGEAEDLLNDLLKLYQNDIPKTDFLLKAASTLPGIYVPAFYKVSYHTDGTIKSFDPIKDVPRRIKRVYVDTAIRPPAQSCLFSSETTFNDTFLIEVSRGCRYGCRFCAAGFVYRPPRIQKSKAIIESIHTGRKMTNKIGLMGSNLSDIPDIGNLLKIISDHHLEISFSSLRADMLTPEMIQALKAGNVKTATIAPDAGSEKMRKVINKGICEDDILNATTTLVEHGIMNLKLYFMIGLPTETPEDIDELIALCKQIKQRFLKASQARKKIGEITISLNCFVPKPFTPFQWAGMDEVGILKRKIKAIKQEFKKVANMHINTDVPRWAYIQAILARGDRKVADILESVHNNHGNWPQTLKESALDPHFYAHRERKQEEIFPWDFIDHGILKKYLYREFQKALEQKSTPACDPDSCTRCGVCS